MNLNLLLIFYKNIKVWNKQILKNQSLLFFDKFRVFGNSLKKKLLDLNFFRDVK